MTQVVAIYGPTASGKSAVAEELAILLGTDVISADAMQVYRGMDIGTAKLPVDQRKVALHMVDVVDSNEAYSAALYQRDARAFVEQALSGGKVAILCGGTGLYIRAALDDMRFPTGQLTDERRRDYQRLAETAGPAAIHALLAERDPESAAIIHPNNTKRVIRALEMHDEGVSYAEHVQGFQTPVAFYDHVDFALTMQRERLYRRIDARVDQMFEQGLVDEVQGLMAAGAGAALTARQAIGYKEVIAALEGSIAMDEAVALIKQRSRRYAKRQLAWCRRDTRIAWIDMDEHDPVSAARLIAERVVG